MVWTVKILFQKPKKKGNLITKINEIAVMKMIIRIYW